MERDQPGLLKRVLGEIEIADHTNQRRGRPARLFSEDPGGLSCEVVATVQRDPYCSGNSQIGRISMEPVLAVGIFAAHSIA